jgi:hypothetical protein
MTVLTVNNLPAATHGETVRCLFAIELSGMSWVIAFNTPLSEKISRRTLIGCKWKKATRVDRGGAGACQPRDGSGGRNDLVLRGRL